MDLKRYLEQVGETQMEFARRAGISQSQVSRLMRGVHAPTLPTFCRVIRAIERKPPRSGKLPTQRDFVRRFQHKGDANGEAKS